MNYSLNPLEDAIDYLNWMDREEPEEMVKCCISETFCYKSNCVYDKDGGNWVHKTNVADYLKNFEGQMLTEDYNNLKQQLYKQI